MRSDIKDSFRSGLIAKLPLLNEIFSRNVNTQEENVQEVAKLFSQIIRDVADPLFSKIVVHRTGHSFIAEIRTGSIMNAPRQKTQL